ncbi:hypothetical protein A2U01_0095928, partial [Trifolium medium]|nr:hypothetical protein [Trifolium medium]
MTNEERGLMKEVVVEEDEVLRIVLFVDYLVTVYLSARRRMEDVLSVGILVTRR